MDAQQPAALPTQATSFVGRAAELADLAHLLADPRVRLLTIWGPGGIGKTRLALEAAARTATRFADGVVFVPLQAVRNAEGILTALANALAIPLTAAGDPSEQLLAALRDKRLLLLLDNTEQLADEVALCSRLVAAAPGLTLLVTSREALQLQEEWLYPLAGLALPADATQGDAVELFVERARQFGYELRSEAERADAMRICRLVEGMPLAIELAAAWTRTLSCAAIAAEVERGLDLLTARTRNAPERHASLRAVFDESWVLLSAEEQRAFSRLSLFQAGFGAAAAAAVAGASLRLLDELIAKSLLRRVSGERYQIHELLRQYGLERLAQSDAEAARAAAAIGQFYASCLNRWYLACASQGITTAALAALVPELDTIRAAWGDILAQSDGEELRRALFIITYVYFVRGPYSEGAALIEQALARLRSLPDTIERRVAAADCVNSLGWFRLRQGRIGEARQHFADSIASTSALNVPRPDGDPTEPLVGLGIVALVEGDFREAVRLGMAALERAEAEGHRGNQVFGLYVLVGAALAQGQSQVAQRYARRMQELTEALGNRWFLAYCRIELGKAAATLGAYAEARDHYEAAYGLREEFGDPEGMAVALVGQADATLRAGKPVEAEQLYARSLQLYRHLGDRGGLAAALDGLGCACCVLGKYPQARERLLEALRIATEMAYTPLQLLVLTSIAELLLALNRPAAGLALARALAGHAAAGHEVGRRTHALLGDHTRPPQATGRATGEADMLAAAVADALDELATLERAVPAPAPRRSALAPQTTDWVEPLTGREREILRLICTGATNAEIAEQLMVAVGTVKWYTAQIYSKLGVRSRAHAVVRSRELGLLE
jgi:predicted ATPase/DNA-binding CsgD family transcriptional regulator